MTDGPQHLSLAFLCVEKVCTEIRAAAAFAFLRLLIQAHGAGLGAALVPSRLERIAGDINVNGSFEVVQKDKRARYVVKLPLHILYHQPGGEAVGEEHLSQFRTGGRTGTRVVKRRGHFRRVLMMGGFDVAIRCKSHHEGT